MHGAWELLLALLLAACSPGPPPAAAAGLAAGLAHRAAPRNEGTASSRTRTGRHGTPGASAAATAEPRSGRPILPLRRRAPRAPPDSLARHVLLTRGLRDTGAADSSRLSGGSRSVSRVCVENSLLFRSNVPYPTDTVAVPGQHDLLFCVQLDDSKLNLLQYPPDIKESDFFKFVGKYSRQSFLAPSQVQPLFSAFYRAGDPILIYSKSSSVLSTLRQPSKMGASGLCVDGNPAGFLDSKTTSCTRIFANLSKSCIADPALNAASYYHDFTVLKVPVNGTIVQSMKVTVTAVAPPGAPHMKDNTCHDAVSEVIYEIEYSGTHGIQSVSVQFKVTNISGNSGSSLQQHFTLHFWTRALSDRLPRSGNPGYITGAPLLIVNSGAMQHMSILQSRGDGSCSQFLRHTVQFGRNTRTGCKLSLSPMLEESNCSYIQQKLYKALQGMNGAEDLAITGSAHPTQTEEWTAILIHNCSMQAVNCTSCCMIPVSLEIQILWTKVGLLSNPQAQILGAQYFYQCHPLKHKGLFNLPQEVLLQQEFPKRSHEFCFGAFLHGFALEAIFWNVSREFLSTSTVPLLTVVTFTDMTEWPEPPRGQPQMHWKLPFDIFFPFKVALNLERSYRDNLAGYFLLILIMSSFLWF